MSVENFGGAPKRWGVVLMVLVILILLILGVIIFHTVMQRNKAALELTPEDAIQAFREAGFEIKDLTYDVYYPADYVGEWGVEFTTVFKSETYSILVALYSSKGEAQRIARGVNGLNRSMNGGHASASSYGAMLIQVYPSDEMLNNRFHSILKQID
jgi:hypothetical protein